MIGFAERHRAGEVLSQLQRLKFDWTSDLHSGIAVEVETDGRLRMLQSHLLDPASRIVNSFDWEGFLNAIVPQPHLPSSSRVALSSQMHKVNADGRTWLKTLWFDPDFARNAAALLQPGNSAILATITDWQSAAILLSGYSNLVLHTTLVQSHHSST